MGSFAGLMLMVEKVVMFVVERVVMMLVVGMVVMMLVVAGKGNDIKRQPLSALAFRPASLLGYKSNQPFPVLQYFFGVTLSSQNNFFGEPHTDCFTSLLSSG